MSTDKEQSKVDAVVMDADKQQKRLANLEKARAAAAAARKAQGEMTRIQKEKIKLEKLAAKEQLANEVKALKQQITAAPAAPVHGTAPKPKKTKVTKAPPPPPPPHRDSDSSSSNVDDQGSATDSTTSDDNSSVNEQMLQRIGEKSAKRQLKAARSQAIKDKIKAYENQLLYKSIFG
eukprot:jgi/Chrzof1/14267/Cz08g31190.t1